MKSKCTKLFLSVLLVLSMCPMFAQAAECLDVRDYGEHRYSHRRYEPYRTNIVVMYIDSKGRMVVYYDLAQRQQCICGAERIAIISTGNVSYE